MSGSGDELPVGDDVVGYRTDRAASLAEESGQGDDRGRFAVAVQHAGPGPGVEYVQMPRLEVCAHRRASDSTEVTVARTRHSNVVLLIELLGRARHRDDDLVGRHGWIRGRDVRAGHSLVPHDARRHPDIAR